MTRFKKLIVGAALLPFVAGGALVASSASAEPKPEPRLAAATTHWGKFDASGRQLAGDGSITSVNHFGGGRYNLFTNFDATNCALTGTLNTQGGNDPGPGNSSTLLGLVNSSTLFVRAATPPGVDNDRPFSVAIFC
ncbi:hypothetical protein ACFWIQ_24885 [Kitasatospora sp. NPDC127059]|uniref:hypothetical protein n=1 Tax=unclassified Kitasatospora TaxID=2633591 RepID=UPI00364D1FDE